MNNNMGKHRGGQRTAPHGRGSAYLATVGMLMLVIIVMLAVLFWRERSLRATAENEYLTVLQALQSDMATLAIREATDTDGELARGQLPVISVELNGVATRMLVVGPEDGKGIGLVPGDLVMVLNREPGVVAPDTRPAE